MTCIDKKHNFEILKKDRLIFNPNKNQLMKKSYLLIFSIFAVLYSFAGNNFPLKDHGKNYEKSLLLPTPSVSIVESTNNICVSTSLASINFTATLSIGSPSQFNYNWKRNGNSVLNGTGRDFLVTSSYANGDVFTCEINPTGQLNSTSTSNEITLTVNNSKDTTATACDVFFFRGNGPYTTSGVYPIVFSNGSSCDSVINLYLTVSKPAKPSITASNIEICSLVGSVANYSLTNPNISYYHNWIAPTGPRIIGQANIVSGQGSETVGLTFTSALSNRLLYLQVYDSNMVTGCVGEIDSLLLTMTVPALDTILPISGLSSLCASQLNGLTYTANPGLNAASITGYTWSITPATVGDIISGQSTNSVTVNFNPTAVTYTVKVAVLSACGSRAARALNIRKTGASATPTSISSSFNPNVPPVTRVCGPGTYTYRIRITQGAVSYNWSLKNGTNATIEHLSSGSTDTAVNVIFDAGFTSDSLIVSATNICATSLSRRIYLSVNTSSPPSVASLSGENSPCRGSVYNYTATANTPTSVQTSLSSFRWYLPANTTITSSNADSSSVSILYGNAFTGGNIIIRSQSTCGIINSNYKTLVTKYGAPGMKSITGQLSPCTNNSYTYSDTSLNIASTQTAIAYYRWTRPTGTTIASSNADSSIVNINFGSTFTGGVISSYGVNACGASGSSKTIQLKYLPPTPTNITSRSGNYNACIGDTISYTVVVPSPGASQQAAARFRWTKPSTTTILSANADSSQIKLQFNTGYVGGSSGGKLSVYSVNACGALGSYKYVSLTHAGCTSGTKSPLLYSRTSGVSELFNVNVFPNPSNTGFNLNVNSVDQSPVSVIIMDVQGKIINKLNVNPFENINIGNSLKPGTYMIETKQGNQIKTTRIVKY
jgi:hypothetical protein